MDALPRVLTSLHKNLQRTAVLGACVATAPRSRVTTATALAAQYAALLQRSIEVSPAERSRVEHYLEDRRLAPVYAPAGRAKSTVPQHSAMVIEAQDWFLSEPSLPSSTGREKDESYRRTIAVCVEMGLLHNKTLTITPFGSLLLALGEMRKVVEAFKTAQRNPFVPDEAFVAAVMFQVFRCDAMFQLQLLSRLPPDYFSFRDHIVRIAEDVLRSVDAQTPKTAANRSTVEWLRTQVRT